MQGLWQEVMEWLPKAGAVLAATLYGRTWDEYESAVRAADVEYWRWRFGRFGDFQ